jgi:hypothetical protein
VYVDVITYSEAIYHAQVERFTILFHVGGHTIRGTHPLTPLSSAGFSSSGSLIAHQKSNNNFMVVQDGYEKDSNLTYK